MIDPKQLQALVDGECSAAERRALLNQIASEPHGWRTLALSLLEEQVFQKEMANSFNRPVSATPVSSSLCRESSSRSAHQSSRDKSLYWLPALAACLMMAIGFAVGRLGNSLPERKGVDLAAKSGQLSSNDQLARDDEREAYESGLRYADLRVKTENGEIPIYDAKYVDPTLLMAKQAYELQMANERLRQKGYELEMQHQYMTGRLRDGRELVVPIQEVGLRPYGQ